MTQEKQICRTVAAPGRTLEFDSFLRIRLDRWFWHILVISVICSLIAGCSLTTPSDATNELNEPDAQTISGTTNPAEVWIALAQGVKAKTIGTTTRLAQYVVVLSRNGELSDRDVALFDTAFPNIATNSRNLTDVDIRTLIELGKKTKP